MVHKLGLLLVGFIFASVIFLFSNKVAQAATLYWVGSDGANASVATNWSTTNPTSCSTGVTPSASIPGSSDQMNFDADCDNGATIDSGFSSTVSSVVLNSGYGGTVTQANPLTVSTTFTTSGGTWNASNQALTVTSTFTMNTGGIFYSSSGNTTFGGSFTINGGTWDSTVNSGGVVIFGGGSGTLSCNNISFNLVKLGANNGSKTIGSNCTLPLGSSPQPFSVVAIILNGTLTGSGTLDLLSQSSNITLNSGAALQGFSGITTTNLTVAGANLDFSNYTSVILRNNFSLSSGTFIAPSSMNVGLPGSTGSNFTVSGGTFNANGGTVILNRNAVQALSGNITFYNLKSTFSSGSVNPSLHFSAGSVITVQGTLSLGNDGVITNISSSSPSTKWFINAQGGRNLHNLSVQDSGNTNSVFMVCSNCVDLGNNTGWLFQNQSSISFFLDYPGGNSHITNTNPTYRWKKASSSANSAITKYELFIQPKDVNENNIGTALYIDNIVPFVGDNKKYLYYPTYTIYDDGDYLNLTPNNYLLTPGKYNFRIVAHDSVGNVVENSYDFYVDDVNSPALVPQNNTVILTSNVNTNNVTIPQNTTNQTSAPVASSLPFAQPVIENKKKGFFASVIESILDFLKKFFKK